MLIYILMQLFTDLHYFAFNAFFSLNYSSTIFRIISVITGMISILLFFRQLIKEERIQNKKLFFLFFLSIIGIGVIYAYSKYFSTGISAFVESNYLFFFLKSIPSALLGLYCINREWKDKELNLIYPYVVITSIITILIIIKNRTLYLGRTIEFGGGNYQDFSFFSLVSIIMILLYAYKKKKLPLPLLTMLLVHFIGVIYGSGRSALYATIVVIAIYFIKSEFVTKISNFLFLGIGIMGAFLFFTKISIGQRFQLALEKFFNIGNIFQSGKINWEETSGRHSIYQGALKVFGEAPFIGHGLGSVFAVSGHGGFSHNIVLDFLVEFGLILTIILMILFAYLMYSYWKLNAANSIHFFVLLVFFMMFVKLMFGSYYLGESGLWFSIAYYMGLPKKEDKGELL